MRERHRFGRRVAAETRRRRERKLLDEQLRRRRVGFELGDDVELRRGQLRVDIELRLVVERQRLPELRNDLELLRAADLQRGLVVLLSGEWAVQQQRRGCCSGLVCNAALKCVTSCKGTGELCSSQADCCATQTYCDGTQCAQCKSLTTTCTEDYECCSFRCVSGHCGDN